MTGLAENERKPSKLGLVALLVVIILGVGLYFWLFHEGEDRLDQSAISPSLQVQGPSSSEAVEEPTVTGDDSLGDSSSDGAQGSAGPGAASSSAPVVALFGVERSGGASRPDAVAVLGLDRQTGNPIVVALQPDLELSGGEESIASAFARLGPLAVTRSIGTLLSVPLSQYIVLDYQVFESIIDRLGGIEVTVNETFAATSADGSRVVLRPGTQTLNGKQALAYVRYKWAGDETARLSRQAAFLQGLRSRLLRKEVVAMLPALVRDTFALVETNVTLTSALSIVDGLRWSEMGAYRLIVIADGVRSDGGFVVYRTPEDFVRSGIEFAGIE